MRTLRLVALSDDGKSLVLAAGGTDPADGERFELPIDDRVRAAARGDARRLTQIDVDAGVELPPRVIQARIRAGETPEQVAAASGTRVERIMRFAHPVIQERARVAEQAREARVRLSEGPPTVALGQFMTDRLRLIDSDIDAVTWDAHRTDDGTWQITGSWRAGAKSGTTRWTFDIPSRTVAPYDAATTDFAEGTRLVRVVPDVPNGAPVGGGPGPRGRAVSFVRGRAPDALVHDTVTPDVLPADLRADDDEHVRDVHPAVGAPDEPSVEDLLDEVAEHDTVVLGRGTGEEGEDGDPRARIPAWEDIVFGVRRHR
ncbi:septation protein SepH [Blastococcus sp. PRF04-17]|uniref:septation protein SepH n=1 Tax=Blastococcus sp. PRF04-17 TaxID=2933797 RepID=UPI001FF215B8|nr:septation protein SepH [Blastococcus sp. PRF04-17]UOX99834.1 septation protein SepH [Blastococcus sp. PRF04-17]